MVTFTDMAGVIPEGSSGTARIEHFTVDAEQSRWTSFRREEHVPPGIYCRLYVGSSLMMSDTRMERSSNYEVVRQARGEVLIAGLGVGLILIPILAKPEVKAVTVVERYKGVIDLVGPPLQSVPGADKLTIIEADILEYKVLPKGRKWDCIYFDIWPDICTDNLVTMTRLHRKFGHHRAQGSWMSSWKRDYLLYLRRRGF